MAVSPRAGVAAPPGQRLEQARKTLIQALSLLLALLASLLVGYLLSTRFLVSSAPAVAATTATVTRGNIQATVSTTGSVVATTQAKLTFGTSGRLAELNVQVGDQVVQGQQLAKLDTAALQIKLSQAQSNLRQQQIKLQALQQGARPEDIAAARASVQSAQARLADLSAGPSDADVQTAQQGVVAAQAQLTKAQADLDKLLSPPADTDVQTAQQGVVAAQAQLTKAQNDLDKLLAGPTEADLQPLRAAVEQKRAALVKAQADYDAIASRPGAGASQQALALQQATIDYQIAQANLASKLAPPAAGDVDAARQNVASAQAQLDAALAKYNSLFAGPKPGDVDSARAAVASAQAQLDAAQAKYNSLFAAPKAGDLETARANLASAQATLAQKTAPATETDLALQMEAVVVAQTQVDQAELDLQSATLTAPFAGRVAAIGAQPGEQVSGTAAVVTLVDPSKVRVDVSVDESDVARLAVGQNALITFDALPGQTFTGKVLAIAPQATVQQGVSTYPVSLSIDTRGETLPAGMSASVRIVTQQRQNVLLVPNRAIRLQGRTRLVDVLTADGKTEARPVQVGLANDQQTEITSGLNEGEVVVIPSTTTRPANVNLGGGGFGGPGGGPVVVPR